MHPVCLQNPKKVFPKFVWLKVLSFLPPSDLRESFLVCKDWHSLGTDTSLDYISNREIIRKINDINSLSSIEKIFFLLTPTKKNLEFGDKGGKMLKRKLKHAILLLVYSVRLLLVVPIAFKSNILSKLELILNLALILVGIRGVKFKKNEG